MEEDKQSGKSQVDENLRRVFEPTLSEDLPDRFKELLQKLKSGSGDTGANGGDTEADT